MTQKQQGGETTLNTADVRLAYEAIIGRCSDSHWYRVKRLLQQHKLELTVPNIQFFAQIRQQIPRSAIGVNGILECYGKAEAILNKSNRSFKGSEVLTVLRGYGINPHASTVTRWFRILGGYRKDKEYSAQQLKPIFTSAFLYKAHHSIGLPEAN